MPDREASLLTPQQRKYLKGDVKYDKPATERKMKNRIRERVYTGLELDGKILSEVEPEERRKIFEYGRDKEIESKYKPDIPKRRDMGSIWLKLLDSQINIGSICLLGFLFLGLEEKGEDFEDILELGIDLAVRKKGLSVKSLEFDVEFSKLASIEDISEWLEEGDMEFSELTPEEAVRLVKSGEMDFEDFPDEFQEFLIKVTDFFQSMEED